MPKSSDNPQKENPSNVNEKQTSSSTKTSNSAELKGMCSCSRDIQSEKPGYDISNHSCPKKNSTCEQEIGIKRTENNKLILCTSKKMEAITETNHCPSFSCASTTNNNSQQITQISENNQIPSVNLPIISLGNSCIANRPRISLSDIDKVLEIQYNVLCARSKYYHLLNQINQRDLNETACEISTSDSHDDSLTQNLNLANVQPPAGIKLNTELDAGDSDDTSLGSIWSETCNDEAHLQSLNRNSSWWDLELAAYILSDRISEILEDFDRLLKDLDRGFSWQRLVRKGADSCQSDANRPVRSVGWWIVLTIFRQWKDFKIQAEIMHFWLIKANLLVSNAAFHDELMDIIFGIKVIICTVLINDTMRQNANILESIPLALRTNNDVNFVFNVKKQVSFLVGRLWSVISYVERMQEIIS